MNCSKCNEKDVSTSYIEPTKREMIKLQVCFNCHFWIEKQEDEKDPEKRVIVKGELYHIGRENPQSNINPHQFRGFGGRKFEIEFFDGRKVTSTNLWFCGPIPKMFQDKLPDNAKFEKVQEESIDHGQGFLGWK